jgi:hypothetical protein
MSGLFGLAKVVVLVLGLALLANVRAQEPGEDQFAPRIFPSMLFRLDRLITPGVGTTGLQAAVQAQGVLPHERGAVFVDAALWLLPIPGVAVLEAYTALNQGDLAFSVGKRARYTGPWNQGVLGYDGLPGLYLNYLLEEALELEGAFVLEDGLLRTYLGANWGPFELGLLLRPSLSPRVVFKADIFTIGLQTDRGVWGTLDLPVDLFEGIPLNLEGSVWWQPGFADLNNQRTFVTQRFFLSLAARIEGARFGFDVVRAPLEAYRLWLDYRLRW